MDKRDRLKIVEILKQHLKNKTLKDVYKQHLSNMFIRVGRKKQKVTYAQLWLIVNRYHADLPEVSNEKAYKLRKSKNERV